jgi:hypothetical protein
VVHHTNRANRRGLFLVAFRVLGILGFLGGALGFAGGAHAQCPKGTYFVDLTTGQTFPSTAPARITLLSIGTTPNPDCPTSWYAAALRVDLAPPCSEASVVVEYDKPIGFTLNIGDSPTNDAYGGDSTTPNNSEAWINQQILWVAGSRLGPGDNNLYQENMSLNYGAIKFTVKNQWLSWGTPYHVLQTVGTKQLFALPDRAFPAEGSYIYVGLNRVIGNFPSRSGCGLERAMITVE